MECGGSVRPFVRHLLVVLALLMAAPNCFANEKLVLIVSADSQVEQLDSLEVRKLFLGLTVVHNGRRLRPLLNEIEPHLKDIFLQNIVSMSDITYDHHLLGMALKQGKSQPDIYKDAALLYAAVAANTNAVSFAWLKDVEKHPRLKVLRVLWHD